MSDDLSYSNSEEEAVVKLDNQNKYYLFKTNPFTQSVSCTNADIGDLFATSAKIIVIFGKIENDMLNSLLPGSTFYRPLEIVACDTGTVPVLHDAKIQSRVNP
ncbi:unnamed protein product, partial [Didymodactylos carnosus]